jgi:hypothetical protein
MARLIRRFAFGALVGPGLLTLAWIVLGLLMPPVTTEYGVQGGVIGTVTSPISGIGVGPHGTLFNAAFIISGLLTMLGVIGIFQTLEPSGRPTARWINAALLALSPVGFVVAGIFTLSGSVLLHFVGFLLVAATPVVSFLTTGLFLRRVPTWRRFGNWLILGSPLTLLLVIFFFLSFDQETIAAGRGIAGIASRLLALEIGAWFAAMGWLAHRPLPPITAQG